MTASLQVAARIALTALGIALIGAIDYTTGVELRVYPLYFGPVGYAAWHFGRRGAIIFAVLGASTWLVSNELGGLTYSATHIWIVNTLVQLVSLLTVGLLIAIVRKAELRQRGLSAVDTVTALLNRRGFLESGLRVLERCARVGSPITIAYIDLDNFKQVNDSLGHHAGDTVLRQVADLIRLAVRPSDLTARLGGDEFAVLLPDVDAATAAVILERVRASLANAFALSPFPVSGSIGAASFAAAPRDFDAMVRKADAAMYAAKAAGRNRVEILAVGREDLLAPAAPPAHGPRGAY